MAMIWTILALAVTADVTFLEAKQGSAGLQHAQTDSRGPISALEQKRGDDDDDDDSDDIADDEQELEDEEKKGMKEMMTSDTMKMLGNNMVKIMMAMRQTLVFGMIKGMSTKLAEMKAIPNPDHAAMKKIAGKMMFLMASVDSLKDEISEGLDDDDDTGGADATKPFGANATKMEAKMKESVELISNVRNSLTHQLMDDIMHKVEGHIMTFLTMQGLKKMEQTDTVPKPGEMQAEMERLMALKNMMEMREAKKAALMKSRAAMTQGITTLLDQIMSNFIKDAHGGKDDSKQAKPTATGGGTTTTTTTQSTGGGTTPTTTPQSTGGGTTPTTTPQSTGGGTTTATTTDSMQATMTQMIVQR